MRLQILRRGPFNSLVEVKARHIKLLVKTTPFEGFKRLNFRDKKTEICKLQASSFTKGYFCVRYTTVISYVRHKYWCIQLFRDIYGCPKSVKAYAGMWRGRVLSPSVSARKQHKHMYWCFFLLSCSNTLNLNQATLNYYYPHYQSALSRTFLRFYGTTFVETAV